MVIHVINAYSSTICGNEINLKEFSGNSLNCISCTEAEPEQFLIKGGIFNELPLSSINASFNLLKLLIRSLSKTAA